MYLENINGPEDVKKLSLEEMETLAEEMRGALLKRAILVLTLVWWKRPLLSTMCLSPQRIRLYLMYHIRHTLTRC